MNPGIAVKPRASIGPHTGNICGVSGYRGDSAVSNDDGALVDHVAVADDDSDVGDDQILRRQIGNGGQVHEIREKDKGQVIGSFAEVLEIDGAQAVYC